MRAPVSAVSALCVLLGVVLLPACKVKEDRFISELTTGDCVYATSCWSEDVLTQYGYDSQEACEADRGPINARLPLDCMEYDPKLARECIKALDGRTCDDEGSPTDLGRPAACDQVFTSCEGGDIDDTDGVEPTDDTDSGSDTDA